MARLPFDCRLEDVSDVDIEWKKHPFDYSLKKPHVKQPQTRKNALCVVICSIDTVYRALTKRGTVETTCEQQVAPSIDTLRRFFENNANLKNFSADSIPFADLSQGLRCLIIKKYRISRNLILSGCQRNGNTMSQRSAFVFVFRVY